MCFGVGGVRVGGLCSRAFSVFSLGSSARLPGADTMGVVPPTPTPSLAGPIGWFFGPSYFTSSGLKSAALAMVLSSVYSGVPGGSTISSPTAGAIMTGLVLRGSGLNSVSFVATRMTTVYIPPTGVVKVLRPEAVPTVPTVMKSPATTAT